MGAGEGVMQRQVVVRLAELHSPDLPDLWHQIAFDISPTCPGLSVDIDASSGAPIRTAGRQDVFASGISDKHKSWIATNMDKATLLLALIDPKSGRSNEHLRNRLLWEFHLECGLFRSEPVDPVVGTGYSVGLIAAGDERSRRNSVHRAVQALARNGKIEARSALPGRNKREVWVRRPLTRSDSSKSLALRAQIASNEERMVSVKRHLRSPNEVCLDGLECSKEKHDALQSEIFRSANWLQDLEGRMVHPELWAKPLILD